MLIQFSPLLINFSIIFLCIFYYEIFWVNQMEKKKGAKNKNRILIAVLCFISILFVMYFPFTLSPGNIFDLRKIPLLIGILYGGYTVGLILTATIIVWRFFLGGGVGAWNTFILYSILYFFTCKFLQLYHQMPLRRKIISASGLAGLSSLPGPVFDFFQGVQIDAEKLLFYSIYFLLNTLTMSLAIYLIEKMKSNYQLRQEIIQNEKTKVLSQLAASVAHEIRNPLTTSRGFMQLIQKEGHPALERYASLAISEMDRAQEIINDYLSFAKPDVRQNEKVCLSDLFNYVLNIISPFAHFNNVEIISKIGENLSVWGDRKGLAQCFINLLKNSVEAMPEGGQIQVKSRGAGDRVEILIMDTGIGMTSEQISRLGSPFYSTKEKGTGLGLMVTFSIIHSLKGTIKIESEQNKGTTFLISLPNSNHGE